MTGEPEVVTPPATWPGEADGYRWRYLSDLTKNDWANDAFYVRVWDDEGIYWHGTEGEPFNPALSDSPNVVYLSAGFHDSTAQEYKTSKLILELYSL